MELLFWKILWSFIKKKKICISAVTLVTIFISRESNTAGIAPWSQIKEYLRIFNYLQVHKSLFIFLIGAVWNSGNKWELYALVF